MLPSRLPDPVPPARHELSASYISRLATLHGLDISTLWTQTTTREPSGGMRRIIVPERLAALTGRTVHELAGALPELRDPAPPWEMFRHQPQTGCHRCDARHPGGKVTRLLPHHRYVCTRHRTWIGPPDTNRPATDLTILPAVVQAQRLHLRLVRQHGWAATYDAVLTGFLLCSHIWNQHPGLGNRGPVWHTWESRTHVLIPPPDELKEFSASRLFAAIYPETVRVAALIASPFWRDLASGTPDQKKRFYREISTRVSYPYTDNPDLGDAIAHWAHTDAWRPPTGPHHRFTPGRVTAVLPAVHQGQLNRHQRSALWFKRGRKAGKALLWHNHIKPVLVRPWTPNYERLEGAISFSQRIDPEIQATTARQRASQPKPTPRAQDQHTSPMQ
ncbi:TniQ family protein [Streptacidiphilus sp. P02-A3a]|uniref:TniQ family protein n=1 Tax=Streptacidiphilus sp. P02-A3a TaxID=2704468 RepID=UPI0015FBEDA5|nr:TniQ family protein [Streptacidiphilus sp. P02-A3a]QMU72583.1 hypothetical protein GXP74_34405 [Streptacidiphilus sp. P02-A3a]